MIVYGIDPGEKQSAVVGWDGEKVVLAIENSNDLVLGFLAESAGEVAIEQLRGYGMVVGNETLDTTWWSGRFYEAAQGRCTMIPRKDVLSHICENRKAGDKEIRAALIDKIGAQGTKKNPGPLKAIAGTHLFAALAVAVTHHDRLGGRDG